MIAAPITPARSPSLHGTMRRSRVAREGATDDSLANAGQEVLVRFGDVPADDDHRGIEEVDRPCEHLAECAPGVAHHPDRAGVAAPHEADDVAAGT